MGAWGRRHGHNQLPAAAEGLRQGCLENELRASPTAMTPFQPLPILDLEKQTHVNWGLGDKHANCPLEEPAKRVNTGKRCTV